MKNKKKIKVIYKYAKSKDSEQRLDEAFDFIFDTTLEIMKKESDDESRLLKSVKED